MHVTGRDEGHDATHPTYNALLRLCSHLWLFPGFLASNVGQSFGWDNHSVNANHTVFGLFVHLFDFGDKDDKILT